MNNDLILVDATYIHSFGGKTIFELFIREILKTNIQNSFFFLLDKRNESNEIKNFDQSKLYFTNNNEYSRLKFYLNNKSRFKSVLCLASIPPPIHVVFNVFIYFHNINFSKIKINKVGLKYYFINKFKKSYINFLNRDNYKVIVQTSTVKSILSKLGPYKKNDKKIFPFFDETNTENNIERIKNTFIYVADNQPHKNHKRLLNAFIVVTSKMKKNIYLNLTMSREDFINSVYCKSKIPKNLIIKNKSNLNRSQLNQLYSENTFLIYPSLNESFGLPLIEATLNGCKVIASDCRFVKEVMKPSLVFNPLNENDIAQKIFFSLNQNLKFSKLIINNKISTFVKYICENV